MLQPVPGRVEYKLGPNDCVYFHIMIIFFKTSWFRLYHDYKQSQRTQLKASTYIDHLSRWFVIVQILYLTSNRLASDNLFFMKYHMRSTFGEMDSKVN